LIGDCKYTIDTTSGNDEMTIPAILKLIQCPRVVPGQRIACEGSIRSYNY